MRRRKGLTLVEILVALVVLSIIGAVVATALISNMRLNAEGRVREQALAATQTWLDRFRAKTLDFSAFQSGQTYDYGYDYASDPTFIAAGDPNPTILNSEWGPFKFEVKTETYITSPLIWRVRITTYYRKPGGGEGRYQVETLIAQ